VGLEANANTILLVGARDEIRGHSGTPERQFEKQHQQFNETTVAQAPLTREGLINSPRAYSLVGENFCGLPVEN
jgi:hypothetical protein